jgi:hypothetical protein
MADGGFSMKHVSVPLPYPTDVTDAQSAPIAPMVPMKTGGRLGIHYSRRLNDR